VGVGVGALEPDPDPGYKRARDAVYLTYGIVKHPSLRIPLALLLLAVLVCGGLVGAILAELRPGPADEAIVRARAPRVVRNAEVDTGCRLDVDVRRLGEGDGEPGAAVPEATVTIEGGWNETPWSVTPILGADGTVRVEVPCDGGIIRAEAPGFVRASEGFVGKEGEAVQRLLVLIPGVRIHGTVTSEAGEPVAGAAVLAYADTVTDADGTYTIWVLPGKGSMRAEAFGFEPGFHAYDAGGDHPDGLRHDFVLVPRHELRVWCAGLPDDGCGDVMLLCTSAWSPMGEACSYDSASRETTCICPAGEAAVRGGGRAVLVDADADDAWLDFRDAGRIVGRVIVEGAPAEQCTVEAVRIPDALEDLPRGLVALHRTHCDADGRFVLDGLVAGDWQMSAKAYGEEFYERSLIPRRVRLRDEVDVGDITLPGGGGIDGIVVDGLTGAPADEEAVVAWREGVGGERTTFAGEDCGYDGDFRMRGLPPGTWTVAHILAPHDGVTVTVTEGAVTRGVRITTSDATALEENGFALTEEEGALVVQDVTPGSPADEAGLEPGEEVVGVLVGGFDMSSAMGEHGQDFTRALLGHWDGPGVTLVVRSPDGGEEEVPLEW
jgi:hypothetical protein